MNPCAKCRTPVGDDAVFLKNGTYVCPVCYQKYYGAKNEDAPAKTTNISPGAVIAIITVIGIFALGYKMYSNSVESSRIAAVAEKEKIEKDRLREDDDRKAAALTREKFEEEHKRTLAKQEQERQERIQRDKAVVENAAKVRAESERLAREKTLRTKDSNTEASRLALLAQAKAAAELEATAKQKTEKERSTEIKSQSIAVVALTKDLKPLEAAKITAAAKMPGWKNLLASAIKNRDAMIAVYKIDFPRHLADKIESVDGWRNNTGGVSENPTGTGSSIVRDRTDEFKAKVHKYDQYRSEMVKYQENVDKSAVEIADLDLKITETKSKLDAANARLAELKPTPEELEQVPGEKSAAKTPLKVMVLKNGNTIFVKSFITVDAEIHYKDEAGKSHVIKKDEVEKLQ